MFASRNKIIISFFTILFLVLIVRLFYFQICMGENLSRAAIAQRMRDTADIGKIRGNILDRNLIPFTNRNPMYTIALKPLYLRESEEELQRVCEILNLNIQKMRREIEVLREPIFIETDKKTKEMISELNLKGMSIINSLKRYDENSVARHVTGYLNSVDGVGEAGIEKFYEDVLKHDKEDSVGVITDAKNNLVQGLGYRILAFPAVIGKLNVKLTLDYHIQKIAEDVMGNSRVAGAVVIEDILNGDIVAMVSKPDFNQNDISRYLESHGMELFNRAVASYNLGSIFKIIDTALFFENGGDPDREYLCNGSIRVGERDFKCYEHDKGGHGWVNMSTAFKLSCNPYFIDTGLKLGYRQLVGMAKTFGIGEITGIKYQGVDESPGNLPMIEGYYSDGDIANISIGQGEIMATPLQVANIVATLANGGIMNKVNIVDSIIDDNGNKVRDIRVRGSNRIVSIETADKVKKLMEDVTTSGTGMKANINEYGGTAGKTGSAETGRNNIVHAWFAGYFPQKTPKYSMAVFVEGGRSGGDIAAPIFAGIAMNIMEKGY